MKIIFTDETYNTGSKNILIELAFDVSKFKFSCYREYNVSTAVKTTTLKLDTLEIEIDKDPNNYICYNWIQSDKNSTEHYKNIKVIIYNPNIENEIIRTFILEKAECITCRTRNIGLNATHFNTTLTLSSKTIDTGSYEKFNVYE